MFLTDILQPLLRFVPSHLQSTADFIARLTAFEPSFNHSLKFASLDVTNLYGSIPILNAEVMDLVTCVQNLFRRHYSDSGAPNLHVDDVKTLLLLATMEDNYILDGKIRKQSTGLAMGNNAAPILASIFMHFVEEKIFERYEIPFWARFVDDVFLVYEPRDDLLEIVNAVHGNISFTVEHSVSDTLPFLDTLVTWSEDLRKFEFSLYVKPVHSGACLPFSSHVPAQRS